MSTVRALVDTTDGQRIVADIEITRETRLGCGCTRLEGIRPGPQPSPVGGVHLLTGCSWHQDGRTDPGRSAEADRRLAEARRNGSDDSWWEDR